MPQVRSLMLGAAACDVPMVCAAAMLCMLFCMVQACRVQALVAPCPLRWSEGSAPLLRDVRACGAPHPQRSIRTPASASACDRPAKYAWASMLAASVHTGCSGLYGIEAGSSCQMAFAKQHWHGMYKERPTICINQGFELDKTHLGSHHRCCEETRDQAAQLQRT